MQFVMSQRASMPLPVLVIASAKGSDVRLTANTGLINVLLSEVFFFPRIYNSNFPSSTMVINDQRLQNNNYKVLHHPRVWGRGRGRGKGGSCLKAHVRKTFFQPSVTLWLDGFGFMARCYSNSLKLCVQVYKDTSGSPWRPQTAIFLSE